MKFIHRSFLIIAILFFKTCKSLFQSSKYGVYNSKKVFSKFNRALSDSLWSDRVEYVDLTSSKEDFSPLSRPLPLFLLQGAFYPSGISYIHVFEMKYRTMMFDCANSDEMFGYIHTDSRTGSIAKYGTMCKIIQRQLLEDGRQYIAFEGTSRFRVRKILKTLPYILAEVEPNVMDEPIVILPDGKDPASLLEIELYNNLKYYIRLLKEYDPNRKISISHSAKATRPSQANKEADQNLRRTNFSFALANMVQITSDKESQLLLQTTDIIKRLKAQNQILLQACELVTEEVLKKPGFTEAMKDNIRTLSFNSSFDGDILPPDVIEAVDQTKKDEWDISNIE
jgi:Lon protease-like protein